MIKIFEPYLSEQELQNVIDSVSTGWISSQGSYVNKFEEKLAQFHNVKFCVAVMNCTVALHLGMRAIGLKRGDEIICPDLTFIAPANMALLTTENVLLVDVDKRTLNISLSEVEKKISQKTKAIICVNQFGHPCDYDKMREILVLKKFNIPIIEDNAECLGGFYKSKITGTFGKFSTISFFGNKIITTGEGGALITEERDLFEKLRILRDHGMNPSQKYDHLDLGFNYRMTNMQAAIGVAQLDRFEEIRDLREEQSWLYKKELNNLEEIQLRKFEEWCKPVHWLQTIFLPSKEKKIELMSFLQNLGIETRPMIKPVSKSRHFKKLGLAKLNKNAIVSSDLGLHLPSGTGLKKEDIIKITNSIKSYFCKEND